MLHYGSVHCSADSACLPLQCVPAAAPSNRGAHNTAALWPHEAEVQGVCPGTDTAELEVLDCILLNDLVHGLHVIDPLSNPSFMCDSLISTTGCHNIYLTLEENLVGFFAPPCVVIIIIFFFLAFQPKLCPSLEGYSVITCLHFSSKKYIFCSCTVEHCARQVFSQFWQQTKINESKGGLLKSQVQKLVHPSCQSSSSLPNKWNRSNREVTRRVSSAMPNYVSIY